MTKRTPTTKDIGLLKQLHDQGQLSLAPEFQRNGVWPRAAKAYLIDTILNDRPIPLLFFQRISSAQTGKPGYVVIDGQQRLRAIFEFLDDRFSLVQTKPATPYSGKRFSELESHHQDAIRDYDLIVQELTGYDEGDIKDIFVRMNKYVVKLSSQELRHAKASGKFHDFVERVGTWPFWKENKIFSKQQLLRMRAVEFAAELAILLLEGPQDKKAAIDLYYGEYRSSFSEARFVENVLKQYLEWIDQALPDLSRTRFRSPTDFYSLVGALHEVTKEGKNIRKLSSGRAGEALRGFAARMRAEPPMGEAARYLAAASRQTDNIQPRATRIDILTKILRKI